MTRVLLCTRYSSQKSKAGIILVDLLSRLPLSNAPGVPEKTVTPGTLLSKDLSTFTISTQNTSGRTLNFPYSQSRYQSILPGRRRFLGLRCPGHATFRSLPPITKSTARTSGIPTQIFHTSLPKGPTPSPRLRIVEHTTNHPFMRRILRAILSSRPASSPRLPLGLPVRPALPYNMRLTGSLQLMEHGSPV